MRERAHPALNESRQAMRHEDDLEVSGVHTGARLDIVDDPSQRRILIDFKDIAVRLVAGKSHVSHDEDVLRAGDLWGDDKLQAEPLSTALADLQLAGSLSGAEQAEDPKVADFLLVVVIKRNDAGVRGPEP
jgi:hypothetical protein